MADLVEEVAWLNHRIELHRAGEALSGHSVAHVDVSVRRLEAVLRHLAVVEKRIEPFIAIMDRAESEGFTPEIEQALMDFRAVVLKGNSNG